MKKLPKLKLDNNSFVAFLGAHLVAQTPLEVINLEATKHFPEHHLKHAHGHVIDHLTYEMLRKADHVELRPASIHLKYGNPASLEGMTTVPIRYSGQLRVDGEIDFYDSVTDRYDSASGIYFVIPE